MWLMVLSSVVTGLLVAVREEVEDEGHDLGEVAMHLLLPMLGLQVPARWQSGQFFKTVNIRQNLKRSIMYWFWQRSTSFRFSIWQPWGWIQVRQEDEKKMMIIIDKEAGLIPVLRRERLAVGWGRRFVPSRGPRGSRQGAGGTSSDNQSCSGDVLVRACCTPATKVPRSDLLQVAFCAASNPPQSQRPPADDDDGDDGDGDDD